MAIIRLETEIDAPVALCFDISRSADAHLESMSHTGESVVKGRRSGLFERGDTVTWRAFHFGIRQQLSVEITRMEPPHFFEDRMLKGAFKSMCHEHHFLANARGTTMRDVFRYEVPAGILGRWFDKLILERYMTSLIRHRNATIKRLAEKRAG